MAAVALISSNSACSTSPERHRRSGSTRSAQDPGFLPEIPFPDVEDAVASFRSICDSRRGDIASFMERIRPEVALGAAMTLAGYLAWPELVRPLWRIWDAQAEGEKGRLLTHAVWMLGRCDTADVQPHLRTAILHLRTLRKDQGTDGGKETASHDIGPVKRCTIALYHARRWPVSSLAVATWVQIAEECPDLHSAMYVLLSGLDDPDAMRVYVNLSAEGLGSRWWFWGERAHVDSEDRALPMLAITRDYLWHRAETEPDETAQWIAFELWERALSTSDLARLQAVTEGSALFNTALRARLHLHDRTAVPYLLERLRTDPGRWGAYVGSFYTEPGVATVLLDSAHVLFQSDGNAKYSLCHDLPDEGITALAEQCHDLLCQCSYTWNDLWRSHNPAALALVGDAIAQAPEGEIHHLFTHGSFPFPVTPTMLDALLSTLDRWPSQERGILATLALLSDCEQWVKRHLPDITIAVVRNGVHMLTMEAVLTTLTDTATRVAGGRPISSTEWDFRLLQEGHTTIDLMHTVDDWLGAQPDRSRLIVGALLLEARGTDRDISWWQAREPREKETHAIWANTLITLRRRRWMPVISTGD